LDKQESRLVISQVKSGFTFIELIFAIVIIGISILSLPMIVQETSKGIEKNLVQEAILLASADTIRAMSGMWDENSKPADNKNLDFEYVVFTSDAEVTLADKNTSRLGNIKIFYQPDNTLRPSLIIDGSDDVDDYAVSNIDAVDDTGSAENFKDQYKKTISVVGNASFGTLVNNPNLKRITIQYHSSNAENLVQLHMYVANTGSAASANRTLP